MNEATINGQPYPIVSDAKEGLLWRVADVGQPIEETWSDWSGGGFETERKSKRGYHLSDGFDATTEGVLRLAPYILRLNDTALSTNHGWGFEAKGPSQNVAFDAAGAGSVTDAGTSLTFSHVVGSGSDRLLLVGVVIPDTSQPVPSVTYGGVPLTAVLISVDTSFWYLLNPPTGTANVVVTWTNSGYGAAGSTSWTNVSQITPFGTGVAATGTSTTPSVTVTSATGEFVVDTVHIVGTNVATKDVTQTENWNVLGARRSASSRETGAASVAMDWSLAAPAVAWRIIAIPVKAVVNQKFIYWADGNKIFKFADSASAISEVTAEVTVTSASFGRPAYFLGKWYVPAGSGANTRRLDAIGSTTDTWADSGFVALHLSTFQKGLTPTLARAYSTNKIATASAAPTAEGSFSDLGSGVGDTSTTITDLVETQGYLFVAKEDGLYEFDSDGVPRPVLIGLSRGNVDSQNGKGTLAFGDVVFYPYSGGVIRYQIGSGARPMGYETLRTFRRVENTGVPSVKDRRCAFVVNAGEYFYVTYNDLASYSLLCQFRFRREDEPGAGEFVWHSLDDIDQVKGMFVDSENHLWLKGVSSNSAVRDIMVLQLAPDGSVDVLNRKGAASATATIYFDEWLLNDGELAQLRAFEVMLANWDATASLQPKVFRDTGNSAESVLPAITADGLTVNNWTVGTNDTARRVRPVIEVTTSSFTPLLDDPMILRLRLKGRTPMIYRCVIDANDTVLGGYGLTAENARQNLYRLQDQGVIAIAEPATDGPRTSTFNAEVVAVKDVRYATPQGIGYGIELTLKRWIHD